MLLKSTKTCMIVQRLFYLDFEIHTDPWKIDIVGYYILIVDPPCINHRVNEFFSAVFGI